ncbi:MAG: PilZ domain-containing protein, partial [Bacteroidota bacterium]
VLDLSPTGCKMRSDVALNTGTYLALQIALAQGRTPLTVEVSVVRWSKDGHVGVEFIRYSQGDRERVTDLVGIMPPAEMPAQPDYATSTLTAISA